MGKLIDKYLRELSQGENLKVSKVLQVAENLPDLARDWFDKRVYLFYSVEEILSKVPITCLRAVRSTCKLWTVLSKDMVLCKTGITHQFIGFMVKEYRICSMRFHLHGLGSSIKDIGNLFNQVEICNIVHCDGLLLCVTKEDKRLMLWNPYLGQTRCIQIQPVNNYYRLVSSDKYAFGYDNKNHNHKILIFLDVNRYEIYDFSSNSWRILDIIPYDDIWYRGRGASLKGNTQSIIIPHILNGSLIFF